MQIVLLKKVRNLGNLGDIVNVAPGFGRNFLLPQKYAVPATPDNIKKFEENRANLEKQAQQTFSQAEQRAVKISDLTLVIEAQATDEGKLYGSVGTNEIREALAKKSIEISKREIVLPEGPFHLSGDYEVEIHLHSDVVANLKIQIKGAK